ncbi:MAG: hypothetical protein WBD56_03700 [Anaerolineales bacterium]
MPSGEGAGAKLLTAASVNWRSPLPSGWMAKISMSGVVLPFTCQGKKIRPPSELQAG